MPTDATTCYETADASLFTQFDTGKDGVYLLPYTGLLAVHLPTPADGGTEQMTLLYVTHTVTITGTNLTALLDPIQRGRAKKIYTGGDKGRLKEVEESFSPK